MSRRWGIRAALALVFSISAPALLQAQQQYQDPANFPNTYFTQRTTPAATVGQQRIDVTYFIDPVAYNPLNPNRAAEAALIRLAATIWSSTSASVNLVEVGSAAAGNIDFTTANLGNPLLLSSENITSVPGAGTYPDGSPWRHITNAAITIDLNPPGPNPYFYGPPGNAPANQFDYLTVVMREFGFGLGLGLAAADPNSVMDPNITTGEQHRSLDPADAAALALLYGTPEPATWALFGLGLLLVGFRRKFIF